MRPADDALVIDTTGLDLEHVVARIEAEILRSGLSGKVAT